MGTAMLLNSDYERCAEAMVRTFGLRTAGRRAELRAQEMLRDGNKDCADIWTKVAAAIRQQSEAQAA
jgi:hypothetical protein